MVNEEGRNTPNEEGGDGGTSDNGMAGEAEMNQEGADSQEDDKADFFSPRSDFISSQSTESSFDTGSTSVTAESRCIDSSSLRSAVHPSHHSSFSEPSIATSPSHDMAGLPLFGGTFRHWMSGATASPPKSSSVDATVHMSLSNKRSVEALHNIGSGSPVQHARLRQPGIREHTDESCDLPRSNDIMQHLAENCRNPNAYHIGTDGRRLTSYGSTVVAHPGQEDTYEHIEADLDQLKEDMSRLKAGSTTESARMGTDKESAAARLQRQHEAAKSSDKYPMLEHGQGESLPSALDFPILNPGSPKASEGSLADNNRKLSYADVATTGIKDINHTLFGNPEMHMNSKLMESKSSDQVFATSTVSRKQTTSSAVQEAMERHEDDSSVIISSETVKAEDSSVFQSAMFEDGASTTIEKPGKQAPHFAQPTKAFSQRTGNTLRKEPASFNTTKFPVEGSPKSMRSKEASFGTKERITQRQQKRKSLPNDWFGSGGNESKETTPTPVADSTSTPELSLSYTTCPSPAGKKPHGESPSTKEKVADPKSKDFKAQSPLRKKASNFMAPTNATTQRNKATLGQEKSQRTSPRGKTASQKPKASREPPQPPSTPRSVTVCSDSSSVQFILESSPGDVSKAPGRITEVYQRGHLQHGSNASMSPPSAQLNVSIPRSPTKTPKPSPRAENKSRQNTTSMEAAKSIPLSMASLPQVANTTIKRRTSRGHLLKPVVDRVKANGMECLLRTEPDNNTLSILSLHGASNQPFDNSTITLDSVADWANRRSEAKSDISQSAKASGANRNAIPPRLRSRQTSNASCSTDATLHLATISSMPGEEIVSTVARSHPMTPLAGKGATDILPAAGNSDTSRKSSLRATAVEFKPTTTLPDNPAKPMTRIDIGYMPDEEWFNKSVMERRAISTLRHSQTMGGNWQTNRFSRPAIHQNFQSPWGNTAERSEQRSPHSVEPGQVLKPCVSPGKNTIQWMLHDIDGKETPIKFGRAPPPSNVSPAFGYPSPSFSPASDDTSPLKTPQSLRGWRIGSSLSPNPYGWTGGDGKEIRFIGYGPHAERDPNSVVKFDWQGRSSNLNAAAVPNGFSVEDKENIPEAGELVAPRSQRQWAEKMGYKRAPCGNVEMAHAVETIPFGSELAGYCFDCAAK